MIEINNATKRRVDSRAAKLLAGRFLRAYRFPGADLSLAVVGPGRIRSLNRRYRGIDKTTDVLSFPAPARERRRYLGEVVINAVETDKIGKYEDMLREIGLSAAGRRPAAIKNYLFFFLLIHGLLHLAGYDDRTDAQRLKMLRLGKKFLAGAGKML